MPDAPQRSDAADAALPKAAPEAPITAQRFQPLVDHRMFVLRDPSHRQTPRSAGVPDPDELLCPGPGGVIFGSSGDAFYADVLVEVWAAEPAQNSEQWEECAQTTFTSDSGRLRLETTMGGLVGRELPRMPPGVICLRAYCRGRGEASERLGVELYYSGVEEWLIQLWPARVCAGEALPAELVHLLIHRIGVAETEVAAMTKQHAIKRLNEYWVEGR